MRRHLPKILGNCLSAYQSRQSKVFAGAGFHLKDIFGMSSLTDNPYSVLMYLRPARLVSVRVTGAYEDAIPQAWQDLVRWYKEHGIAPPKGRGFGLARDNPAEAGKSNCRYDACLTATPEVEAMARGELRLMTLPGGAYACRRLRGGHGDVRSVIAGVFSAFRPLPGLELDPCRPVISVYADEEGRAENDRRVDVCVPVVAVNDMAKSLALV
jgi:AraC family transcriptional regulator